MIKQADYCMNTDVNAGQRRTLWVLLLILALVSVGQWSGDRLCLDRAQSDSIAPSDELADKINPNHASWASLVRLPGIGPVRARAIVDYRVSQGARRVSDAPVFTSADDLAQVRGIGPITAERIAEFLNCNNP